MFLLIIWVFLLIIWVFLFDEFLFDKCSLMFITIDDLVGVFSGIHRGRSWRCVPNHGKSRSSTPTTLSGTRKTTPCSLNPNTRRIGGGGDPSKQACQVSINGGGLSQQTKGSSRAISTTCWVSGLVIDECENMKWDGGFYRERRGSRGREGTNERKAHHAVGGEEVGVPPSPLRR